MLQMYYGDTTEVDVLFFILDFFMKAHEVLTGHWFCFLADLHDLGRSICFYDFLLT